MMLENLSSYSYAADPETLAAHRAYERQLAELERREKAVQARARRIRTLRQHCRTAIGSCGSTALMT
jgi:hypothetical protein